MNFSTQKTTFFWILLIVFNCLVLTVNAKPTRDIKTLNVNGKEIKFSTTPNQQILLNNRLKSRDVLQKTISKAYKLKITEPVLYLLDSITEKDITLSTETDVEAAIEYKYDNQGRIFSEISKTYTSPETYDITYKSIYQYGEDYILRLDYDYSNEETGFSVTKSKFDNAGKIIQEKTGSDSLDLNSFDNTIAYNYDNNLLKSVVTTLGENSFPFDKTLYSYDSKQRLDSIIYYSNNGLDSLIYISKLEYKYDSSDNLLKEEVFGWDTEGWYSQAYTDYVFNSDNNCTDMIYTEPMSEDFIIKTVYRFDYNTNVNNSDIFSGSAFDDYSFSFKHQMTRSKAKILLNDEMLAEYQSDLYYSMKQTSGTVNTPQSSDYKFTYNANNNTFTILNLKEFENTGINLYDTTGKLIQTMTLKSNTFNLSGIKKGLYYYHLTVNSNSSSGKILID